MSEQPPHPAQRCLSVPTGYYQNEKVFEEEPEDRETDSMLGSHRVMPAVANPEYFEQDGDEVWETKAVLNGLPHNGPAAFLPQDVAQAADRDNGHNYYNDFSHPPPPPPQGAVAGAGAGAGRGGRVLVRDQLPSESQV